MARKDESSALSFRASNPAGYQQCDWDSAGRRCRYPGSISTNTGAGGPYFCRLHFGCADPIFGAQIVEASQDYQHPTEAERMAERQKEADAFCKKMGLETVEQKRAYVRGMFKNIAKRAA